MKAKNGVFRTFAILSYIANGLSAVIFLWFFMACLINGVAAIESSTLDSLFGGGMLVFAAMGGLLFAVSILSILGVAKMQRGKRVGYFIYAISNGLWALILFYAASSGQVWLFLMGLVSLVFIGYFALRLPKLS